MFGNIGRYFFGFFDLLDNSWSYLSSELMNKFEFKHKEEVLNQIKFFETRMKQFNPISVFIGTFVMLMLILYTFKLLKRFWKKISKLIIL